MPRPLLWKASATTGSPVSLSSRFSVDEIERRRLSWLWMITVEPL